MLLVVVVMRRRRMVMPLLEEVRRRVVVVIVTIAADTMPTAGVRRSFPIVIILRSVLMLSLLIQPLLFPSRFIRRSASSGRHQRRRRRRRRNLRLPILLRIRLVGIHSF